MSQQFLVGAAVFTLYNAVLALVMWNLFRKMEETLIDRFLVHASAILITAVWTIAPAIVATQRAEWWTVVAIGVPMVVALASGHIGLRMRRVEKSKAKESTADPVAA